MSESMNYTQTIENVIDNFDFEKVRKVMIALDWKWYNVHGPYTVPDILRMKTNARRLLRHVANANEVNVSIESGGFIASRYGNNVLKLLFKVEDSESFYYDKELGYYVCYEDGYRCIVQHIFKSDEVLVGTRWAAADGGKTIVSLNFVDVSTNELTYFDGEKYKNKDIFTFQSHYSLIVDENASEMLSKAKSMTTT